MGWTEWCWSYDPIPRWEPWPEWDFLAVQTPKPRTPLGRSGLPDDNARRGAGHTAAIGMVHPTDDRRAPSTHRCGGPKPSSTRTE